MNDFEQERTDGEQELTQLPETDGRQEPLPQTQSEADTALDEELEHIRSLVQQALDGEELPEKEKENEDEDGEEQLPDREYTEDELCECCGEKPKDFEKGESYPYCKDCTRLMVKTPLGFKGILVIVIALVLGAASLYLSISKYDAEADLYALEAGSQAADGYLNSALDNYIRYFSAYQGKTDSMGKKVALRAAKLYAQCGYYSDAHDLITNLFSEEELNSSSYKALKQIEDEYDALNLTYEAVYSLISEPLSKPEVSDKEVKAVLDSLDKLKSENPKDRDENATAEKYSEFFIEYYKYMVLANTGASLKEQYEQVKKVAEMDEAKLWVYGSTLCSLSSRLGLLEETQQIHDRLLAFNKEDTTACACLANVYRFCEQPDADKMLEILENGRTSANAIEVDRLCAVAYLIKGENEKAMESAKAAYEAAYAGQQLSAPVVATYALCAAVMEDDEAYEDVEMMLAYSGYSMFEPVQKYKDGKAGLKDILFDAEGELA